MTGVQTCALPISAYFLSRSADAAGASAREAARDDAVEHWILARNVGSYLPKWVGDRIPEEMKP